MLWPQGKPRCRVTSNSKKARLALQAGLTQPPIDAIAERRTPDFSDPDDRLVYDFCRDCYDDHRVDDATYE